ncbi:MAG: hypothetical protein FWG69_04625 [Oscillospiraceae bacterium]|nr:hypothetical protein [Oscillospiraceae bacterium]
MKLSKREKVLLIVLGVSIVIATYAFLFLIPNIRKTNEVAGQVARLEEEVQQAEKGVEEWEQLSAKKEQILKKTLYISDVFDDEKVLEKLNNIILPRGENIMMNFPPIGGVRRKSINEEGKQVESAAAFYSVSINFTAASQNDVLSIVNELSAKDSGIGVLDMSYSRVGERENEFQVSMIVTFVAAK